MPATDYDALKFHDGLVKLKSLREQGTALLDAAPRTSPQPTPTDSTLLFKDFKDGNFDNWYVTFEF